MIATPTMSLLYTATTVQRSGKWSSESVTASWRQLGVTCLRGNTRYHLCLTKKSAKEGRALVGGDVLVAFRSRSVLC